MPGAIIAFDQDWGSVSSGSPGVARNDGRVNRLVTARSTASGNSTYEWSLLDKPPGSSTTLANDNTANCTFTPDLPGTYRMQLVTNGGGPGNVQILVFAVRYDTNGVLINRGWRMPAFGESSSENNFSGQTRGWAEAWEYIFSDIRTILQGLASKLSVKAVATANRALSGLAPIDGYTPVAGDRILLAGNTTASENGIWVAAAGAWSRATDMQALTHAAGAHVFVEKGTTYQDTLWFCTTDGPTDIVGTDNLTFIQFTASSPDATLASKGIVQLAGDLRGTAAAPLVKSISGDNTGLAVGTYSKVDETAWQYMNQHRRPGSLLTLGDGANNDVVIFALNNNEGYTLKASISFQNATASIVGLVDVTVQVYRNGGGATIKGIADISTKNDTNLTVTVQVSGNNVLLRFVDDGVNALYVGYEATIMRLKTA